LECTKLETTRKKNKGFVKKYNPDLLVTLFGMVRSKIRDVRRNGTIETT